MITYHKSFQVIHYGPEAKNNPNRRSLADPTLQEDVSDIKLAQYVAPRNAIYTRLLVRTCTVCLQLPAIGILLHQTNNVSSCLS